MAPGLTTLAFFLPELLAPRSLRFIGRVLCSNAIGLERELVVTLVACLCEVALLEVSLRVSCSMRVSAGPMLLLAVWTRLCASSLDRCTFRSQLSQSVRKCRTASCHE